MRIIAFIGQLAVIEKILTHLGPWRAQSPADRCPQRCSAKFKLTAFAKFKLFAFPVGCVESLGKEGSVDTIREALKKRP